MTTRNFRVKNGLSVGDIVINSSTNKITGLSTSTPEADGDAVVKGYLDSRLSALSSNSISQLNTSVTVTDTGADGTITMAADGGTVFQATATEITLTAPTVTVSGNLTVNGTTTTVNTTNMAVADNIIELNSGISQSFNDAGFIIERGSTGNNAAFIWDESEDEFILGTTTAVAGDKSGGITVTEGTLRCTVTSAQYSDVAERFASDGMYEPGTVVALGGAAEITAVAEEASDEVFGVISGEHQAAFKMNGGAGSNATHPYVAMTGRVDVKVMGPVSKGDRLISSSVSGYARAATKVECTAFNVIGRALNSKQSQGAGSVLAAVRVSH